MLDTKIITIFNKSSKQHFIAINNTYVYYGIYMYFIDVLNVE